MRHRFLFRVALPMAGSSQVGGRLKAILLPSRDRRPLARRRIAIAAALALACLAPLAAMRQGSDDLVSAMRRGYLPDTPANREANIALIKAAIRKYGPQDPWAGKAYYELAEGQMSSGHPADAVASFDACLRLPEPPYKDNHIHVTARHQRMYALASAGRYREAIAAADALIASRQAWSQAADLVFNARASKPGYLTMLAVAEDRDAAARQYASFPADPRWTQTLADGTRVELVGVLQTQGKTRTTWTPDGRLLTRTDYHDLDTGMTAQYPGRQTVRQFAVRLTYPPGRRVRLSCDLTGTDGGWGWPNGPTTNNGVELTDEREISRATGGLRIIEGVFPKALSRTTLRVGVRTEPETQPRSDKWAEFRDVPLQPKQRLRKQ